MKKAIIISALGFGDINFTRAKIDALSTGVRGWHGFASLVKSSEKFLGWRNE